MQSGIRFREADEADVNTIATLLQEHYEFMRETFSHTRHIISWPHSDVGLEFVSKFVPGDELHKSWIAEDAQGAAIGYLLGKIYSTAHRSDNPISEIDNIFITKAARGKGVAKKLVNLFNEWSLKNNVKRMKAQTYADNFDAHQFYESLGMKQIEVIYEIPKFELESQVK